MIRSKTRSERSLHTSIHSKVFISQTLISEIRASEGSKLPFLKNLYGILVYLSNKSVLGLNSEDIRFEMREFVMKSNDRENLGEILFKELEFRFQKFFSALCSHEERGVWLHSKMSACVDDLAQLLRCCMVLLTLADLDVAFEKTQILLGYLEKLISFVHRGDKSNSITFEKRVSREFSYLDAACTTSVSEDYVALFSIIEPSSPCAPSLSAIFEVFADELLMHRLLREYFMRAVASNTSNSLTVTHFHDGGIGIVLELISLQFFLSFLDEEGSENFLRRLSCRACDDPRVCEISMTSSLSLLFNPSILSAPKVLQAHLLLLISEAIDVSLSEKVKCNMSLMGASYLKILERSIILYNSLMSTFLIEGHPIGRKDLCTSPMLPDRSFKPLLECFILERTREKLDNVIARLVSQWDLQSHKVYDRTSPSILADSVLRANKFRGDKSWGDDILVILKSIVVGAYSDSATDNLLHKRNDSSPQDVYILAALLKLIGSSMLAVIRCLRGGDENPTCFGQASYHKDNEFVTSILGSFQHFSVSLPNQKKLFDSMQAKLTKHKTNKWMLLHISGLLSFSFASGLDFLVENCVFILATLLNLYAFEAGNVAALRDVLDPCSKPISSEEGLGDQNLCHKIASKIQKIHSVYLRSESRLNLEDDRVETSRSVSSIMKGNTCLEEGIEDTCNGKVFLDCLLENTSKISDYDDLADFIECRAGKDYSSWLKDKERHRRWKAKKMAVVRWKKKKKSLKFINGIESYTSFGTKERTMEGVKN